MTEPQQPPSTAPGQISPDGQYLWNGTSWVPNPNLPPVKKKHTVRNVFLVITLLFVVSVGGCLALVGGAVNEVDKSIKENENQEGGSNNPIDIEEGEAFTIGTTSYAAGWTVGEGALGTAEIEGLSVTNTSDENDFPSVEFRFWNDTTILAEVTCGLLDEIPAGATKLLDCFGDESLPKTYNRFTVQNSF